MTLYQFLCRIYRRLFLSDEIVVHKTSKDAPWALVSYIPFALTHWYDDKFLDEHQSRREMFVIDRVLREAGFNVYNISNGFNKELPDRDFKLIFGLEPAFCRACYRYPNAVKIYYATGAYVDHQNDMIKKLTDEFNARYNANIPYRRTVAEHKSAYQADKILQIGSEYTKETYPKEVRTKISLIHQSTQAIRTLDNIEYADENEYFFMSSSGNILKGVPQMIECFSKHPELKLHVVGPLENDVIVALQGVITPNIILHGFMNVNSVDYLNIIKKCNFIIYPSGSEGGVPGAVLNSMKNGLIPICTKWASFDGIEDYGYMMNNVSVEEIEKGLQWSLALSKDDVELRKRKCEDYITRTYNLERFADEFRDYIKKIKF